MRWILDPNVMMYCDPSYIDPKHEQELLEGIDWEKEDCLSDAIKAKYKDKQPKTLARSMLCPSIMRIKRTF